MSKVGEPFKMEPLTRKARNAHKNAKSILCATKPQLDDVMWERKGSKEGKVLVKVVGDDAWHTIRWVQTQNDPDWKIV